MSGDVHYEYRWEDRSLILRWLRDPIFMPIVRALPRRLTPNQITMIGHGCLWASAISALLASSRGPLVLLALACGYTAFNLTDTLDGMYARHSGRTSRLGELLDHGIDPVSLGAVMLTFGIVMETPAWLILASTATAACVQFLTFLHGYRVGYVILGEVGIIELLAIVAAVCLAGAMGAQPLLTQPIYFGVSAAGLVALGIIAGALISLLSMRGLVPHARDLLPLAVLMAAIAVWFAFGRIGVTTAGLLILAAAAYESMIVTCSRLRRLPLALWDLPFVLMMATAAGASIALEPGIGIQTGVATMLVGYASVGAARLFFRTAAHLR